VRGVIPWLQLDEADIVNDFTPDEEYPESCTHVYLFKIHRKAKFYQNDKNTPRSLMGHRLWLDTNMNGELVVANMQDMRMKDHTALFRKCLWTAFEELCPLNEETKFKSIATPLGMTIIRLEQLYEQIYLLTRTLEMNPLANGLVHVSVNESDEEHFSLRCTVGKQKIIGHDIALSKMSDIVVFQLRWSAELIGRTRHWFPQAEITLRAFTRDMDSVYDVIARCFEQGRPLRSLRDSLDDLFRQLVKGLYNVTIKPKREYS